MTASGKAADGSSPSAKKGKGGKDTEKQVGGAGGKPQTATEQTRHTTVQKVGQTLIMVRAVSCFSSKGLMARREARVTASIIIHDNTGS